MTGSIRKLVWLTLAAAFPSTARAQTMLDEFSYEHLRASGIQLDAGILGSTDLEPTMAGGVRLDYGRFAPRVRVLLGLSYYRSDFDAAATARFERRVRGIVIDPSGDDTISVGRVSWADIVAEVDLQYAVAESRVGALFAGVGLGVHFRNGSGAAIAGTFVEDALDDVAAGLNATLGGELRLADAWRATAEARGVLSSGLSTASVRVGVAYRFQGAR